jgi:hypothetical protein
MIIGLAGCGEKKATLTNKTIYGLSFDVPDDFKDFIEKQGIMVSTNKESTASIAVSDIADAQGYALADWTKESYTQATIPNYTDVNFLDFNIEATISGSPALYSHYTTKNSNGVELESYSYIVYFLVEGNDATMFQSITFSFNKDADSSLKANIDVIKNSVKFE